jgi:hypothetical protein
LIDGGENFTRHNRAQMRGETEISARGRRESVTGRKVRLSLFNTPFLTEQIALYPPPLPRREGKGGGELTCLQAGGICPDPLPGTCRPDGLALQSAVALFGLAF